VPELPEVEVVRAGLERHAVDGLITSVEVLHDRPVRRHPDGALGFAAVLTGRSITGARRRGKYLWLPLDNGDALMAHLGMSGQFLIGTDAPDQRHLRVRLRLTMPDGSSEEVRFVDQRMFGGLSVSVGGADVPAEVAHIALDPLDERFEPEAVIRRIRASGSGIKRLLLNQTLVSGVGNIYADEALWRAKVHGERPGRMLTRAQAAGVLDAVTEVMTAALAQGGTSFDALYVNVNGQSGYFDRSLHAYGQEGRPCDRCGTPIRRVSFMNRSSFFCPVCQPVPRRRRAQVGLPA
jgi:formamidopyrimidine-DNA glycosylase